MSGSRDPGRALVPGAVLLLCVLGAAGLASSADPSGSDIDERISRLEAELARNRSEAQAGRGAKVFARSCAACHGRNGQGDGPGAADLDPPPRDLSTRRYRFRTTPTGRMPRPEDLERTIRQGLPGTAMPAFDDLFSEGEIAELVAFVYSLRPGGVDINEIPDSLEFPAVAVETPESLNDGRALYLALGCWRCHGMNGAGDGPSAKTLTDEAERPTHSTDFRYDPFKGGREPEAIVRTLLTGLNGSPMPAYGEALLIASEDALGTESLELASAERKNLERFLGASPSREQLEGMSDSERIALRDERLAALAHYVLSLERRKGFAFRLFRERPEEEARKP